MLAFHSRLLVQCSLPYRRQVTTVWQRTNGKITLSMMANPDIGLPYGVYPRLLLIWVTTEAVRTQQRRIDLHSGLTRFMRELGISPHANGPQMRRFKDQVLRLFSTTMSSYFTDDHHARSQTMTFTDDMELWWDPYRPSEPLQRDSYLILSEKFFQTVTEHAIPLDWRGIQTFKGSALALDIYSWLIYRMGYLKTPTQIPWDLLRWQFGGDYADTKGGRYGFKRDFSAQLQAVLQVYADARVDVDLQHGITLRPSPLHISRR